MSDKYTYKDAQNDLDKILNILPKAMARKRAKGRGWRFEPGRHSLASHGISTVVNGITRWERADNYIGEDYSDYFVVFSKNRDSSILEKSNWDYMVDELGDLEGVEVVRFNHWAVGWIEALIVHEDAEETIDTATDLINQYERYPLLNEQDYFERLNEGALDNIQSHSHVKNRSEASDVYKFLHNYEYDEELEAYDGKAPYPSTDSIEDALIYYKFLNSPAYPKGMDKKDKMDYAFEKMEELSDEQREDVLYYDNTDINEMLGEEFYGDISKLPIHEQRRILGIKSKEKSLKEFR